ncbi:SIR2 family protein [Ornithinimicrobium sp. W1665]|uniref:SIR2 family protein n=1 Tax=Ornithinimicrobium sp. W1665 TaxID=3416666 RepID=UPI003CF85453
MNEPRTGHFFVVHGDLTTLSCDGLLIPCDQDGSVSDWWFDMFQQTPSSGERWEPLPPGAELRRTARGPVRHEFVDTVSTGEDVGALVDVVRRGLAALAQRVGDSAGAGRMVPLLAMPMPGTGNGGLDHRRGAVVQQLVPGLVRSATELRVDIALVVQGGRDYAALQGARGSSSFELSDEHTDHADRLGRLAGADQLSLFVGAGVSVPLGLPSWSGLVNALLTRAGMQTVPDDSTESMLKDAAGQAKSKLGVTYDDTLAKMLHVQRHALGHALLAGLQTQQNVTSNFDRALELAMKPTHGDELKVVAQQWAAAEAPWLLKLHGTAGDRHGVVLTTEDYRAHREAGEPLYGLVQALLMTSHLLFVGFSLTDNAYLEKARPVADIYQRAGAGSRKVATALGLKSLADEERVMDRAFDHLSFGREEHGVPAAARTLEIFLDRVAWTAARSREGAHSYLMDRRYDDLVKEQHGEDLRTALENVRDVARRSKSPAALHVLDQLQEFGAGAP